MDANRSHRDRMVPPIEALSYEILAERIDLTSWPRGEREVVARMIHATADESFASSARIGPDAMSAAVAALDAGAPVVCDTRMVVAGIASVRRAVCFLDDVEPAYPDSPGLTRCASAIRVGARRHPVGALWVIGNAPTALAELLALHEAGRVEPAGVIGLPVGFVGAAQAKAHLWDSPLRHISITNQGERGGSAPAVAALHALHRLAGGDASGTSGPEGSESEQRRDFEQATRGFVELVSSVAADDWEKPGLGEWSVRDLTGHASRALSTLESYLDVKAMAESTEVYDVIDDPLEYFRAVRTSAAADPAAVARRGREAGAALGAKPGAAVTELAERVTALVARAPHSAIVASPIGAMRLGAYLPTRTFELCVHSLDLATALGRPEPAGLARPVAASVALASQIAALLPGAASVLLALTGRRPLPHAYSIL